MQTNINIELPASVNRRLNPARRKAVTCLLVAVVLLGGWVYFTWPREADTLLHVSYDATHWFFVEANAEWRKHAKNDDVDIKMFHAGSVQQGQAVARGLLADVVSFATAADVDTIASRSGHIRRDWRQAFPHQSSPYTSTIVFVVRPGNPKKIYDWPDLMRPDVRSMAPSPRVSGAGRYAWLAAEFFARHQTDDASLRVGDLYRRTELLSLGARRALDVFLRSRTADVFLTWEHEAIRLTEADNPLGAIVYPSVSILAEPVVAVVDTHVEKRDSRSLAVAYLDFLFSEEGQQLAAQHGLRPRLPTAAGHRHFPSIPLASVEAAFGGWENAWHVHFSADGTFEQYYLENLARRGGRE